ncbi:MAG TPA: hypothetical protein VK209_10750 [Candidatus Sulfotelmatobacter sp.]|jgi:hypothetical protein|nr:hypothetical protein [Candidatus Sulfotelmatobacter sp.]
METQKTYSLSLTPENWLNGFFEDNKEEIDLLGIVYETKVMKVLARMLNKRSMKS